MLHSNERIIKHKVGLLNLAEELGNVSKACQMMGLSRDTFYRYRDAVEDGGVEALLERPRRAPNLKNRVDLETENAVVAYAVEYPAHGQVRVSNELRKRGVFVSASGVRSIWMRHGLANFKARLKALEAKVAVASRDQQLLAQLVQQFVPPPARLIGSDVLVLSCQLQPLQDAHLRYSSRG